MIQNDPGYLKWLSSQMWKNSFHLFTDGTEQEVKKVAFQMARVKDTFIHVTKYKGEPVRLLYVSDLEFPFVPSQYYYSCIDEIEGSFIRLADSRSAAIAIGPVSA